MSAGSALLATLVPLVWAGGAALLLVWVAVRRVSALTVGGGGRAPVHRGVPGAARARPGATLRALGRCTRRIAASSCCRSGAWRRAGSRCSRSPSALLAAVGLVLPPRAFRRYVAGLCAAGVLLWAQGNLLLSEYGVLDGGGLDLASHVRRGPVEAGLWVGVFALALVLPGAASRAAPTASALLMALQAALLLLAPLVPAEARPASRERGGRLAAAAPGDLRALRPPQRHPHRAGPVPHVRVQRDPRRRSTRLRPQLVGIHLLPGSPGGVPVHEGERTGDAHRDSVAQRGAVPPLPAAGPLDLRRPRPRGLSAPVPHVLRPPPRRDRADLGGSSRLSATPSPRRTAATATTWTRRRPSCSIFRSFDTRPTA